MRNLFAALPLLLLSFPAAAEPFTYAPPHCDFTITFPEKPFIEEKCTSDKAKACDEVLTYTQMAGPASLNFRVTCIKDDPKILATYKTTNLTSTLDDMVKDTGLTSYGADAAEMENGIKTAVNLAGGIRNDREVVYTGQVWLGKNSIFSLEGEMSGPEDKKINEVYTQILKSVMPKGTEAEAKAKPKPKQP